MRIDVLVGGKFHGDRMAQALVNEGHDLRVFTSLPALRFKPDAPYPIQSFPAAEIVFRLAMLLGQGDRGDHYKMRKLATGSRQWIKKHTGWGDLLLGWSSFSLELIEAKLHRTYTLIRDSAHIVYQTELLEEEYKRRGSFYPRRQFCIDRELEEYELVDRILVPSEFARKSFLQRGFPSSKMGVVNLGVDLSAFSPRKDLTPGTPLRAVYFGALSLQKGIPYLLEAIQGFRKEDIKFTLIGHMSPELKSILKSDERLEILPAMPQPKLAEFIRDMDLFLFPTLQDGFGMTLLQAMASGLFPITTSHCGASEVIEHERDGLVIPPADPLAFKNAIQSVLDNRKGLIEAKACAIQKANRYTWGRYGKTLAGWITQQFTDLPRAAKR